MDVADMTRTSLRLTSPHSRGSQNARDPTGITFKITDKSFVGFGGRRHELLSHLCTSVASDVDACDACVPSSLPSLKSPASHLFKASGPLGDAATTKVLAPLALSSSRANGSTVLLFDEAIEGVFCSPVADARNSRFRHSFRGRFVCLDEPGGYAVVAAARCVVMENLGTMSFYPPL